MNQRAYDRMSATLSVGILAVLAAVSYYLAEFTNQFSELQRARNLGHEADYFVEKLSLTRMNREGQPLFRLSAVQLTHFADDSSSEFERPQLVSLEPEKPLVRITADRGVASDDGDITHLHGNVVLTRAAQGDRPELQIRTEYAQILPNQEIARTDKPVRINYGDSSLTGVGMEFNNSTRVLNVLSEVTGIWTTPASKR
jgi:lipopolysaccharide export system protein LptC